MEGGQGDLAAGATLTLFGMTVISRVCFVLILKMASLVGSESLIMSTMMLRLCPS